MNSNDDNDNDGDTPEEEDENDDGDKDDKDGGRKSDDEVPWLAVTLAMIGALVILLLAVIILLIARWVTFHKQKSKNKKWLL